MTTTTNVYNGIRGEPFEFFLKQVLSLSNLNPKYYEVLLDKEGIKLYTQAFTHRTADEKINYEYLEFLGDTTLNKAIAWYLSRRFSHLNCPEGVKVLTRLKINLISKRSFAMFAKQLSFWDFVSVDLDTRANKMDKTLEDVFEAFFGATEKLIDERVQVGAGYSICYGIISKLLDSRDISLKYDHLFDAKTRLKEIFDYFGDKLGKLKYVTEKNDRLHTTKAILVQPHRQLTLGEGYAPLKVDSEQKASEYAIRELKRLNFVKPLSNDYKLFCSS